MKKVQIYSCFILSLILLAGCNLFRSRPKGFPDKKEFAQILSEIHFTEAVVSQVRNKKREENEKSNSYYSDVLRKYNLTQEKFDTIVSWYASQPVLYQGVYEDVVRILGEKEAKWQNEVEGIKEEIERQKKLRELRNIWTGNKELINLSKKDSVNRKVSFDLKVDTISDVGFQVSASYKFLKGNEIKRASLDLYTMYEDSSIDTIVYNIPISFNSRKVELDLELKDTLNIVRIKGYMLNYDTTEVVNAKISDVEFVYIPVEDSIMEDRE